jgi:uncharacterized membrane protein
MTKFRQQLIVRRRAAVAGMALSLLIAAGMVIGHAVRGPVGESSHLASFAKGCSEGIFVGVVIGLVLHVVAWSRALKDEAKFKALYIKEHDERHRAIAEKTGGYFVTVFVIVLATGGVVASFLNPVVSFTLIAVLVVAEIIAGCLYLYYSRRL